MAAWMLEIMKQTDGCTELKDGSNLIKVKDENSLSMFLLAMVAMYGANQIGLNSVRTEDE